MTAFFTDTRSSMDACPPLEEIAAFLDGMLSPKDRERITAHLASCESCHEVFAATVQFQEEEGSGLGTEGGVVPFPFAGETDRTGVSLPPVVALEKVRLRASRWFAFAASILLAAAVGFFLWRGFFAPPEMVFAGLVEQVEGSTATTEHLYSGETFRSGEAPEYSFAAHPTFLAGVHLFDLRLNLEAEGDAKTTDRLLQSLGLALKEVPGMGPSGELYLQSRQGQLNREALFNQEEEVRQFLSDSPYFQFGLWTEAGRLAALTQSPDFFEDRNNRRFLKHHFKETPWAGDELLEDVPTDLQAIQQIWDSGKLTETEYARLAPHFESIIEAHDTSDEF